MSPTLILVRVRLKTVRHARTSTAGRWEDLRTSSMETEVPVRPLPDFVRTAERNTVLRKSSPHQISLHNPHHIHICRAPKHPFVQHVPLPRPRLTVSFSRSTTPTTHASPPAQPTVARLPAVATQPLDASHSVLDFLSCRSRSFVCDLPRGAVVFRGPLPYLFATPIQHLLPMRFPIGSGCCSWDFDAGGGRMPYRSCGSELHGIIWSGIRLCARGSWRDAALLLTG